MSTYWTSYDATPTGSWELYILKVFHNSLGFPPAILVD